VGYMVSVAPLEQHNCPLMSRALIDDQQFQIQNVVKDTKGSMYLLARVLL